MSDKTQHSPADDAGAVGLFLGAGASYDLGMPLVGELTRDVVCHTGGLHETGDHLDLIRWDFAGCLEPRAHLDTKRTSDTRNFETMNQAMMNVIIVVERVHLRFVG